MRFLLTIISFCIVAEAQASTISPVPAPFVPLAEKPGFADIVLARKVPRADVHGPALTWQLPPNPLEKAHIVIWTRFELRRQPGITAWKALAGLHHANTLGRAGRTGGAGPRSR